MFAVIVCLLGVLGLLLLAEVLWKAHILKGENMRKFTHIGVGSFIAFWPWLISWRAIQIISLAMLVVILLNRRYTFFHFSQKIGRKESGDVFLALAVLICASLTDIKIFFAIAILEASIADGVAAIVGKRFGQRWKYKVFGQPKTVLGSMAFWFASLCILGVGVLLGAHNQIDYQNYAVLLLLLPPILTVVENFSSFGLDNLSAPLVTLLALYIAKSSGV